MPPAGIVSLRTRVQWAESAARAVMREPSLYSVAIERRPNGEDAREEVECGFQRARWSWLRGRLLDVCQVHVADRAETAAVTSYGTFARNQYRRMAAIKEFPFPPRPLDVSSLAIEPAAAHARMVELVRPEPVEPACLGLALTWHEGTLAWQGVLDVPEMGVHTIVLAADTGQVLFHKLDRYHPG